MSTESPRNFRVTIDARILPEGVAVYPPVGFLVSSITEGTVMAVNVQSGSATPFVVNPSLVRTFGLRVDAPRRRLLICNSLGVQVNASSPFQAALLAVDLYNTSRVLFNADLSRLSGVANNSVHFANDVAVDDAGVAYVTDSYGAQIWRVDTSGSASVFVSNEALFGPAGGSQIGLNGIAYVPGAILAVRTSQPMLYRIPIANPSAATVLAVSVPAGMMWRNLDGLAVDASLTTLTAVNNGDGLVYRIRSADNFASTATVVSASPVPPPCVTPTTVALLAGTAFVVCNQRFDPAASNAIVSVPFIPPPSIAVAPLTLPEGISYLPSAGLVISSLASGAVRLVASNNFSVPFTFVPPSATLPLTQTAGIFFDEPRGRLLVCNLLFPPNPSAPVQSALFSFSASTGALLASVDLTPFGPAAASRFANDVVVDGSGNAYVTDSFSAQVLRIDPAFGVSPFAIGGALGSVGDLGPNGIEFWSNNSMAAILVGRSGPNNVSSGLIRLALNQPSAMAKVQITNFANVTGGLFGIDGIRFDAAKSYLYVVNNPAGLIYRLFSSDGWFSATIESAVAVASVQPCITPTTLTLVDGVPHVVCAAAFNPTAVTSVIRVPFAAPVLPLAPSRVEAPTAVASNSLTVAIAVGASVGGVLFVLVVVLAVMLLRARRSKYLEKEMGVR